MKPQIAADVIAKAMLANAEMVSFMAGLVWNMTNVRSGSQADDMNGRSVTD